MGTKTPTAENRLTGVVFVVPSGNTTSHISTLWREHAINRFVQLLILKHLVSTKRPYILKQTCSWKVQVCLSMYDLLVDTRRQRVTMNLSKHGTKSHLIKISRGLNNYPATHKLSVIWSFQCLIKTIYLVLIFLNFSFQIISFLEAVTQRCSVKIMFLKISQNTCPRVFFLIKLQGEDCNFIKKETGAGVFL